jgi:hypothetical protein
MTRLGHVAAKPSTERAVAEAVPGAAPLKNPRHEKLAREYAAGASKAEAWRAIGRDPSIGNQSRTFRRPDICARVEFLRRQFNEMAGISLAALQARLLRFADANVAADFFESSEHGRLKLRDLPSLPRAITAAITELQIDKDGAIKVKVADKLHAVDSLLRTIGGFTPSNGNGATLEDLVMQSMASGGAKMTLQVMTGVPRAPDDPVIVEDVATDDAQDDGTHVANEAAGLEPTIRRVSFSRKSRILRD